MIVQELVAIQERCGCLPAEELRALAQRRSVPLHRVHEVASFYPVFRLRPPPAVEVLVCRDMACHLRGSARLRRSLEALASEIGPQQIVVKGVSCLGRCDFAPSPVSINEHVFWGLPEEEIRKNVRLAAGKEHLPHQQGDRRGRRSSSTATGPTWSGKPSTAWNSTATNRAANASPAGSAHRN